MGTLFKCPKCGYEMADNVNAICMELIENRAFLTNVLSSESLSDEAIKELNKIKSIMDRIDALYK